MQEIVVFMQQHWALSLVLIVVFALLILLEFIKQKRATSSLGPAQLTHFINHENATVVDIRPENDFANGHIIGSISLPLADLETKYKKIDKLKAQPIVVVCSKGIDSSRAVTTLQKKGFTVYILAGGITAWKSADMPLVKNDSRGV